MKEEVVAEFSQLLVSGLALGVIYGLVALGFVIIYRASQVFNFAHGEFLTLGAVVMVFASSPALDIEANPFALGSNSVDGWGLHGCRPYLSDVGHRYRRDAGGALCLAPTGWKTRLRHDYRHALYRRDSSRFIFNIWK